MSEKTQRRRVVKALRPLDAISVENPVYPGTPDVNYIEGWIELKWLRAWPKRDGEVRVDHFTPGQREWIRRRWKRGGAVWVLLQVGREWILLDGDTAARHLGYVDRDTLHRLATASWKNGLKDGELRECLRSYRTGSDDSRTTRTSLSTDDARA